MMKGRLLIKLSRRLLLIRQETTATKQIRENVCLNLTKSLQQHRQTRRLEQKEVKREYLAREERKVLRDGNTVLSKRRPARREPGGI